ncbi:phage tail tip fiber protein [Aeromonas hydrophila]|uniref:phage tail tip fiber protein n=1 Tax=Aeromonas hydrophila TaxID=644 RepID=UPI000760715F|nr:DUF1983 domain-containing protein [Aeromonas hydrophila]KWR69345.1 hypothetical protein ATO50_09315 [Aeromonas hydrophila]
MQILTGQKGDRLDKALTLRDAANLGMLNLRRTPGGTVVPELPPSNHVDPEWSGVQPPHAPLNVSVSGAFHTIVLSWDAPTYRGHSFAEVWRAEDDNLGHAVRVGTTLANVYADAVGKEFNAYYWVRFVNKNAMEGPYQGTAGLHATTSRDVQDILDELQGKIEASHLVQSLLAPIQQVPQLSKNLNQLGASLNEEVLARIHAEETLAQKIAQVTAGFKAADTQLAGQITTETKARASADGALGKRIDTVTAQAGSLKAAVQQQSQAIANLEGGAQAMWSAKASIGEITAGIGLIAKSDGTSQVAISASQIFVFDPNSRTPMAPLFAIDNGQAVIAEAIIRKATIQILRAEKITADYIKAGVSISAPAISGGSFDMGNAFMSGGSAGFGLGGPYAGWGKSWHTIIYSDGSIYTNRLTAQGGRIDNMTMRNCIIEQNCVVKGTIYADRIVGDITTLIKPSGNFNIQAFKRARNLVCIKAIAGSAVVSGSGTMGVTLICKMNGVEAARATTQANYPTGVNQITMRVSMQDAFVIPANTDARITFEVAPFGGVSSISERIVEGNSIWLMGLV